MAVRALLLLALTLLMTRTSDAAPADDAGRAAFIAAMQRIGLRQPDLPDPPKLKKFVIYDYLLAARLRRDLSLHADEALDDRVEEFLKGRGNLPVTRNLKREWLHSLAQRNRWDWFLPRATDTADPQIACDRLAGRLAVGDTATLAQDSLARWSLAQRQPPSCNDVFDWLRKQGAITQDLLESRIRAVLTADLPRFARELLPELPPDRRAPLLRWADLLESPKPTLRMLAANPTLAVEPDALASSFDKLSRSDVAEAFELLPALLSRPDSNAAFAARLNRSAALGAAYGRDSRALAAFEQLPLEAVDPAVQEWRVRAALWKGDWAKVRAWIDEMPPDLATIPRWRYWRARAVAALEGEEAATPLFAEIAELRDFYGYLAADHLERPYQLNAHPTLDDVGVQRALSSEAGIVRARELFIGNQSDDAATEWNAALAGAGPALKIQAARLASSFGWYAQSITTLAETREFDDVVLRYPRPYTEIVSKSSEMSKLDPEWILAVMRQESLFRVDAVSRADARGIMQMQPGTAHQVAKRWHLPRPDPDGLFDPAQAIPLGSAFLRELLDKYSGNLAATLAAYNAGPNSVERWLPAGRMSADVWIENIPYNETRNYVQRIAEHIVAFDFVADRKLPRVSVLLPDLKAGAAGL